jgi:hypothetical protein
VKTTRSAMANAFLRTYLVKAKTLNKYQQCPAAAAFIMRFAGK